MNRREALLALLSFSTALPGIAWAQGRRVRIGYLAPRQRSVFLPAVLRRLGELGYVDGKNLIVEYRSADGDIRRFGPLARELIEAKCDLIFAVGTEHPAQALRDAKSRIPIVLIAVSYDPVKSGVVPSLRRPGGSITGMFVPLPDLAAKHLELMHQALPGAKRFLVLADPLTKDQLEVVRSAAAGLRVEIVAEVFSTPPPHDVDSAFARARAAGAEAAIVLDSASFFDQRGKLAQASVKHRLPAIVNIHYFDEKSFLMSYGANFHTAFARAGDIAASILKGAKPGEIPLEQPAEFELVINLNAAKAFGITVPAPLITRATRLIVE